MRVIPFAGTSTSPNSDRPLKLPAIASGNSPRFPSVRVIVSTGNAPFPDGATDTQKEGSRPPDRPLYQ